MKDFDLEAEDWSDLMDRCRKQDAEKPYNWEIIMQLLAAGARKGEVLRLTFADLQMKPNCRTIEVLVPTKKNPNRRYLVHLAGAEEEPALKVLGIQDIMRAYGKSAR